VTGGPNGAARKLGLKRTTLVAKMSKLGLSRSKESTRDSRSDQKQTNGFGAAAC
jgi:hypothetical protein